MRLSQMTAELTLLFPFFEKNDHYSPSMSQECSLSQIRLILVMYSTSFTQRLYTIEYCLSFNGSWNKDFHKAFLTSTAYTDVSIPISVFPTTGPDRSRCVKV